MATAAAPSPSLPAYARRFTGETLSIHEWSCPGHEACGVEEAGDAFEVVVPRRGRFLREVGGRTELADRGSVSFYHPGEPYRVRHPAPGGDSGTIFRLDPLAAAELVGAHDRAAADRAVLRFPGVRALIDGPAYLRHLLAIRSVDAALAGPLETEERAVAFLHGVLRQAREQKGGSPARDRAVRNRHAVEYAERVREVVGRRYREPISLAEVSRAVGASPFHLSRLVTAATGVSIYRMVTRLRLRDALEQLLATREHLTAIALSVGYGSHSRFTEAFRREFGLTPSELRRSAASSGPAGRSPRSPAPASKMRPRWQ